MNAGRKNKRIQLQEYSKTPDGQGGFSKTWVTRANVWAEFKKPKVSTEEIAGAIASELIREIGIRYRADVRKGWRVLYDGRIYSVDHTYDYDRVDTILVCREVVT